MTKEDQSKQTRRTFMRGAAVAGLAATGLISGSAAADQHEESTTDDEFELILEPAPDGCYYDEEAEEIVCEFNTYPVEPEPVFSEPLVGSEPPQDLNNDGKYEDLDGDGTFDQDDVAALGEIVSAFQRGELQLTPQQIVALDFNNDGQLTGQDVGALAQQL